MQLFNGALANGASQVVTPALGLPAESKALAVSVLSAYSATAGTTGVQLQVGASLDGGATFSDYATVATTAPTPSSGVAVQSEVYASLDAYKGATHLQFKLVNLDGTNNATVTLTFRAAV
jgi:hypothetical protein